MPPRPAAKSGASGSPRRPTQRAADRAVLLVHPVRHRGEHLCRLVVAGRQLDVVRLRDGPEVDLSILSAETRTADPGDPADLGNDSLPDAVVEHDALRSDILTASTAVCYREGPPNMTTDTSTLPRRALVERDDSATPTRRESPLGTDRRRPAARPPRTKRGGGHLLRLLLPDESRQPASDPLLLLGPNGGPLWTSRSQ
jgi:hypothetical protein